MRIKLTSILLLLLSLGAYAEPNAIEKIKVWSYFDKQNSSLDSILNLTPSDWQTITSGVHHSHIGDANYWQGSKGAIVWLKIRIPSLIKDKQVWLELVPNVGLDGQMAYKNNGHWKWASPIGRNGEPLVSSPANFLSFEIATPAEDNIVYVKLNTSQIFHFGINFRNEADLHWSLLKSHLFNGLIFGFLTLAMIYNLAIGFSAGERMYLYYAFYVFSNTIYLAVISGYLRLIFPDWGGDGSLSNLMVLMAIFSATVFVREFLNTEQTTPVFDKVLYYQQGIFFTAILFIVFLSDFTAYFLAELLGLVGPFLLLVSGIVAYRAGHPMAKYFLIAWTLFLICAAIWGWMWLGIIEPRTWVLNLLKAGTIAEITLLTLVLGFRYSYLKKKTETLTEAKSRFKTLSETDELTGVLNRRGFLKQVESLLRKGNKELVWLALDIDHFKRFNDSYGHVAGDKLLNAFGSMLSTKGRREDLAARLISHDKDKPYRRGVAGRIGGEEFAVLLVDCSLPRARLYAERLLREFEKLRVKSMDGEMVGTTLSIGATQVGPGDTVEAAWKRADRLLYEAKHKGRNQVVMRE